MVDSFSIAANIRAMYSTKWLSKDIVFFFLIVVSLVDKSIGKNIKDVDEEEDIIDNIKRVYGDYEHSLVPPHLDLESYRDQRRQAIPKKIPFAVSPRDYRFHLPASVLRGEPEEPNLSPGLMDTEYNYPLRPDEFEPQNPPYYPYQYSRKFHAKHVPFVDYGSDYRLMSPDLTPLGAPHISDSYQDPDSPSMHGYQDVVDQNNLQDLHPHIGPLPQEKTASDSEQVHHYMKDAHHAPQPGYYLNRDAQNDTAMGDFYFIATAIGCTVAALSIIVGAGICYYRLSKSKREAADAEYPAYGVTGPSKDVSPGTADRKLAQSAHMYHYQHQKQQMIAIEKSSSDDRHCLASDADSEEDEEVPDYTVYECPGLAPTDNMEVKNPLFSDDPTPATPASGTGDSRKDPREGQE